jgi:hypothetical protein
MPMLFLLPRITGASAGNGPWSAGHGKSCRMGTAGNRAKAAVAESEGGSHVAERRHCRAGIGAIPRVPRTMELGSGPWRGALPLRTLARGSGARSA